MYTQRFLLKIRQLLKSKTYTQNDIVELWSYCDHKNYVFFIHADTDQHGNLTNRTDTIKNYLHTLTPQQIGKLINDNVKIKTDDYTANELTRPMMVAMLDLLYNGITSKKIEALKKLLPDVASPILWFANDGHFYRDYTNGSRDYLHGQFVWPCADYYQGTPLVYINEILQ